jgi:hypothetical protein
MGIKVAAGLVCFSNVVDRFLPGIPGQSPSRGTAPLLGGRRARHRPDYPLQFDDPVRMQAILDRYGIKLCTGNGIYGERRWARGSLASTDPAIRRQAIELCQRMDVAAEMGVGEILLWPGQDGYRSVPIRLRPGMGQPGRGHR